MGSDRARGSYDPGRDYRALVMQQGRVALEADQNEAARLAEDALRADAIDIIGPSGTPDNGYLVGFDENGAITIGAGTFHLGGWRLTLPQAIPLGGPDALDQPVMSPGADSSVVALLVTEQEVSAVEDRALREIALGGPDTAQRTRLLQRTLALPLDASHCGEVNNALQSWLSARGAVLDFATREVRSKARLRVAVIASPPSPDPCDPPAAGGYLGADNQMLRVTVTAFDPATRRGRLLWGYDNAATLYRASTADGTALVLAEEPIDADHSPRLNQAVEVLRTRRRFDHGEVVAGASGRVGTVAQPYDPDLRQVRLSITLPAGERGDADNPLFLRLWESEIEFTAGTQVTLGQTGLAVTLTIDSFDDTVIARPYWCFAARPSTPQLVYPRRYLDAPQPPEGNRQWIASLAVVDGAGATGRYADLLDDCRQHFLPLTAFTRPCCITLDAATMGHPDAIQFALNRLRGTRGCLELRPGRYKLRRPIKLDPDHIGLTLSGCGEGVFLEAESFGDADFAGGLIQLDDVNEVTLRSLQLQMPAPSAGEGGAAVLTVAGARNFDEEAVLQSVGVQARNCAELTIERCQFRYRFADNQPHVAAGLLLRDGSWGLTLTDTAFLHDVDYRPVEQMPRLVFGLLHVPAVEAKGGRTATGDLRRANPDALFEEALLSGNRFTGLTLSVLVFARLGHVRAERNRVIGGSGGIWLIDGASPAAQRISMQFDQQFGETVHLLAAAIAFTALVAWESPPTVPEPSQDALDIARQESRDMADRMIDQLREESFPLVDSGDDDEEKLGLRRLIEALALLMAARGHRRLPVLHVHANDIEGFGNIERDPEDRQSAKMGSGLPMLLLQMEPRRPGAAIVATGNRAASGTGPSVFIQWPQNLVFGSNLVSGSRSDNPGALCVVTDGRGAMLEMAGNLVDAYYHIVPATRPIQAPETWWAVNRLG